jgi:peptide chain release factor 2
MGFGDGRRGNAFVKILMETDKKIEELEAETMKPDFWNDKERAQNILKEIKELKEGVAQRVLPGGKYDKGDAILTFFPGAGGDDANDWAKMLIEMYEKFAARKGWEIKVLSEYELEIKGKGSYGVLKNEAGVHRLVRISPFSAKKLRHTSFALLEVIPKMVAPGEVEIPEKDIKIELSRAGGPGGQNVNKRETAVRVVHLPTNIAVHVNSERSQSQNKERAMQLLKSKLYKYRSALQEKEKETMQISKVVEAEWGNQIRSYVLHPYKLVKDHRTGVETSDVGSVLNGEIDKFL